MKNKKTNILNQKNKKSKHRLTGFKLVLKYTSILVGSLIVLSVLSVIIYKYAPVYWTPLMSIRRYEARQIGKEFSIRHEWRNLEDISPYMVEAAIVGEDDLFYKHNGFSQKGIQRALDERKKNGEIRHGGSTISQQTAKNVFCTNHRNIFRKGIEAYFTVLIELIWGKDRIMEVYLNSIEMGDGIFGSEAASQAYFHHDAKHLNLSEACLISACIPSPRKWSVRAPGPYVQRRQQALIKRCKKKAYAQPK